MRAVRALVHPDAVMIPCFPLQLRRPLSAGIVLITLLLSQRQVWAQCDPHWVYDIGQPGVDDRVFALTVFDDQLGGGPALYVGGFFLNAGGAPANRIAKWDGSTWSTLGTGMNEAVIALLVWDDGQGGGPALYAGGNFFIAGGQSAGRVAKWNGVSWTPVGTGMNGTVSCFCIYDDGLGGGPALYAGGQFSSAIGVPGTSRIAKWNGSAWSGVGGGTNDQVTKMIVFDDGSGPALWVAGYFSSAGGLPVGHIAKWNGVNWSAAGVLGPTAPEHTHTLAIFDDQSGAGPRLYAAGFFFTADGQTANHVARWNGTNWEPVGGGVAGEVVEFTIFDDRTGGGPALYGSGFFTSAGGNSANSIARWNGSVWTPLGSGLNDQTWAVATFDDGSGRGTSLFAGGFATTAGGQPSSRIAHWVGSGNPSFTQQPEDETVFVGQPITLSAGAIGAIPLSYQWRKDSQDLIDDGRITGATTPTLTIDPTQAGDGGDYDVVVTTTGCGAQSSAIAVRSIIVPGCPGDVNVDGHVNGTDITGFVNCALSGTGCELTDLDDDGLTADLDLADDVSAFATRLVAVDSACL